MSKLRSPVAVRIICDRCNGAGTVSLPDHLLVVLMAVGKGLQTAEAVHSALPGRTDFSVPAVNKRLENLRSLGLVTRERRGKFFFYSIDQTKNPLHSNHPCHKTPSRFRRRVKRPNS